jgi:hypothetical protein
MVMLVACCMLLELNGQHSQACVRASCENENANMKINAATKHPADLPCCYKTGVSVVPIWRDAAMSPCSVKLYPHRHRPWNTGSVLRMSMARMARTRNL